MFVWDKIDLQIAYSGNIVYFRAFVKKLAKFLDSPARPGT